jgi:hypothetical protein
MGYMIWTALYEVVKRNLLVREIDVEAGYNGY